MSSSPGKAMSFKGHKGHHLWLKPCRFEIKLAHLVSSFNCTLDFYFSLKKSLSSKLVGNKLEKLEVMNKQDSPHTYIGFIVYGMKII